MSNPRKENALERSCFCHCYCVRDEGAAAVTGDPALQQHSQLKKGLQQNLIALHLCPRRHLPLLQYPQDKAPPQTRVTCTPTHVGNEERQAPLAGTAFIAS